MPLYHVLLYQATQERSRRWLESAGLELEGCQQRIAVKSHKSRRNSKTDYDLDLHICIYMFEIKLKDNHTLGNMLCLSFMLFSDPNPSRFFSLLIV